MSNEMMIRELNALIELHYDAAEVAQEGAKGMTDPELRADVQGMFVDHEDAVNYLQERVRQLGGIPSTGGHAANVLRESWQKLWQGGGDREALQAMRANERVAVDGLQLLLAKEDLFRTLTHEGKQEYARTLEMELRHFRTLTDRLRSLGVSVGNDEVLGAVRNAAEHIYSALNIPGMAAESFFKWVTGMRSS